VTVTVLAGACGGGNKEAAKPKPKPTTTTRARQTTIDVEIGRAMLETASLSSPPFPDEVRDPVKSELVRYVEVAMITPLRTGKVASSDLGEVFDLGAIYRVNGLERTIVTDEGFGRAVGAVEFAAFPVSLTALADTDGKPVLVSAEVGFVAKGRTRQGKFEISRTGELLLAPVEGGWRITGWNLHVQRRGTGTTPTTTPPPTTASGKKKKKKQ